jgi:hypothetical protein
MTTSMYSVLKILIDSLQIILLTTMLDGQRNDARLISKQGTGTPSPIQA